MHLHGALGQGRGQCDRAQNELVPSPASMVGAVAGCSSRPSDVARARTVCWYQLERALDGLFGACVILQFIGL
jgi:hypothetical protein